MKLKSMLLWTIGALVVLVAASAWNGWMNVLQYVVPIVAIVVALRVLFRALKPRRRRTWAPLERLKARFA